MITVNNDNIVEREIPVSEIRPHPDNERGEITETDVAELMESIADPKVGQLQAIAVEQNGEGEEYLILFGHRRWMAARLLGWKTIRARVYSGALNEAERLTIRVTENEIRKDVRPIQKAKGYRKALETLQIPATELAARLKVATTTITRPLKLLNLIAPLAELIEAGEWSESCGYMVAELLPDEQQRYVQAARDGVSRTKLQAMLKNPEASNGSQGKRPSEPKVSIPFSGGALLVNHNNLAELTEQLKQLSREADKLSANHTVESFANVRKEEATLEQREQEHALKKQELQAKKLHGTPVAEPTSAH